MDERLRRLERLARSGDPEAQRRLEYQRFQILTIPMDRLQILGHFGFEPAQQRLGWTAVTRKIHGMTEKIEKIYTDGKFTRRIVDRIDDVLLNLLERWPKKMVVRAAWYACDAARAKFRREQDSDYLDRVCAAVRRWLDGNEGLRRECIELHNEAWIRETLEMPRRPSSHYDEDPPQLGAHFPGRPPTHVPVHESVRTSMQGASSLVRATFAEMTEGLHDAAPCYEIAGAAFNAMQFAAAVIGEQHALRAIVDGLREWVIDDALTAAGA